VAFDRAWWQKALWNHIVMRNMHLSRFYGTFRPRFFYNPDKPPNPISDFL
jgi:hypothetical protein